MDIYAMPVRVAAGKIKWIHTKDFNPEVHQCNCPQCRADRVACSRITQQIQETKDEYS